LFSQYKFASSSEEKTRLAQQVCKELIVHTLLEEELFYPACREKGVEDDMLDEAQVEHDGAKILIQELLNGSPEAGFYDAKVKVLSEYIKLHVREEEKSSDGIFAKAKAAGVDISALGQRLQTRKQELLAKVEERGLTPPASRSLEQFRQSQYGGQAMARQNYQGRDEQGRFTDDDDRRSGSSRSRYGGDDDYGRRGSYQSNERERDDQGRFMSSDDDQSRGRGGYGGQGRNWEGDWEGRGSRRGGRGGYDDDNGNGSRYSRSGSDDDSRSSSGRGRGWYGDPEGHSRASEQGWEERRGGRGGGDYDDDNRRGSRSSYSRSGSDDDYRSSGGRGRGWFGDSEGHSRASEQGWEERRGGRGDDDDDNRRGGGSRSYSRSGSDDDNRSSRGGGSSGHGGWFGDSRGHAEAARRGWRDR